MKKIKRKLISWVLKRLGYLCVISMDGGALFIQPKSLDEGKWHTIAANIQGIYQDGVEK